LLTKDQIGKISHDFPINGSMQNPRTFFSAELAADAERLRHWLFEAALPLWWEVGSDRSLGGYHERIDFNGRPVALARRSRVAARQAFCYAQAGRLGWAGPWREAAQHALNFLRQRFVQSDGSVIASVDPDGTTFDATFDLYNQAFALLAYACGHAMIDPGGGWQPCAYALVHTLQRDFAHPAGGFREDRDGRLPLRANPHMHLLESALTWLLIDRNKVWRELADDIVALCLSRFVDPGAGTLRELFAADWAPADGIQGEIIEPGHQYEWAFLLARWAKLTGRERPAAVAKLVAFADAKGVDRSRRVAVNSVRLDGQVRDPVARLWPQTERIRAYLADWPEGDQVRLREAIDSLNRYLDAPLPGLWYENLAADGRFVVEAAPATSLYHIVGAVAELCASFGSIR
jgi:mannose/cellobiose epimerase-like protein (N-acyl-D-glucosamine 2-epimerase family)